MLYFVKISIHFLTFYAFGSCLRMLVVPLLFHSFWASKFWDGWIFQQDHVLPSCLTHWVAQQNTAFYHLGLWFNNTGNSYSMVSHREVWAHCALQDHLQQLTYKIRHQLPHWSTGQGMYPKQQLTGGYHQGCVLPNWCTAFSDKKMQTFTVLHE